MKKKKFYKDDDFYLIPFKEKSLYHREDLKLLTKEELIKLFTQESRENGKHLWRIRYLTDLINYLGELSKSTRKYNNNLFFKMMYIGVYNKVRRKYRTHATTAANLDKDDDYKLLLQFGSLSKRWVGDDIKKKETEGEERNYKGHTDRYYKYLKEYKIMRYWDPPITEAEIEELKKQAKDHDTHLELPDE